MPAAGDPIKRRTMIASNWRFRAEADVHNGTALPFHSSYHILDSARGFLQKYIEKSRGVASRQAKIFPVGR